MDNYFALIHINNRLCNNINLFIILVWYIIYINVISTSNKEHIILTIQY